MSGFSVEDLFTVGIGLDLVGAVLIGKSVLADARSLAVAPTWKGVAVRGYVMVRERVDAEFGAGLLVAGFILQLLGYIALLEGHSARTGDSAAALGFLAALGGLTVGTLAWLLFKRWRLRRLLVAIAWRRPAEIAQVNGTVPPSHSAVDKDYLVAAGAELFGEAKLEGEDSDGYALRVFGIGGDATPPGEAKRGYRV